MPQSPDLKPSRIKRPQEVLPVTVDFASEIPDGDTANAQTVTATRVDTGADVTSSLITGSALNDSAVSCKVQAGTDGLDYDIRFRCTTAAGYAFEHVLRIGVRD